MYVSAFGVEDNRISKAKHRSARNFDADSTSGLSQHFAGGAEGVRSRLAGPGVASGVARLKSLKRGVIAGGATAAVTGGAGALAIRADKKRQNDKR